MHNLKKLIGVCVLMSISGIVSGCHKTVPPPDIIMIGDCEHGIVSLNNLSAVREIFPEAQQTDVLIAGGCYQEKFIKKEK